MCVCVLLCYIDMIASKSWFIHIDSIDGFGRSKGTHWVTKLRPGIVRGLLTCSQPMSLKASHLHLMFECKPTSQMYIYQSNLIYSDLI